MVYVVAIVLSVIAGLLIAGLQTRAEGRYRHPASNADQPSRVWPRASLLRICSGWLLAAFASIVVCVAALLLSLLGLKIAKAILLYSILAMFFLGPSAFLVARLPRCPSCRLHVLRGPAWVRPAYPARYRGLQDAGAVALGVLVDRRSHCMHCGQDFHLP
ncbi:hypothetical protein [Nevskia sp.]|uniref:hypothetical protein n=1 Tax=Nevskia sp. TaxID=1929292 RepID=UPI003F7054EA